MADQEINTEGGGVVKGDVNTNGGGFTGRDRSNTTTYSPHTETTTQTNLSGSVVVAVLAVLIVGVISVIVISRYGGDRAQLSQPPNSGITTIPQWSPTSTPYISLDMVWLSDNQLEVSWQNLQANDNLYLLVHDGNRYYDPKPIPIYERSLGQKIRWTPLSRQ